MPGSVPPSWRPIRSRRATRSIDSLTRAWHKSGSNVVKLKLLGALRPSTMFDLDYLGADQPHLNVMVLPNGQTNIPTPKTPSSGGVDPRTVVSLMSNISHPQNAAL